MEKLKFQGLNLSIIQNKWREGLACKSWLTVTHGYGSSCVNWRVTHLLCLKFIPCETRIKLGTQPSWDHRTTFEIQQILGRCHLLPHGHYHLPYTTSVCCFRPCPLQQPMHWLPTVYQSEALKSYTMHVLSRWECKHYLWELEKQPNRLLEGRATRIPSLALCMVPLSPIRKDPEYSTGMTPKQ